MEKHPHETKLNDQTFVNILHRFQSELPDLISEETDGTFLKDEDIPSVPLKDEKLNRSLLDDLEKDFFKPECFEPEGDDQPLAPSLKSDTTSKDDKKEDKPPDDEHTPFMNSFLIELVDSIKNTLSSIYQHTVLNMDKFDDAEIKKHSQHKVKEDIKKIDSVLNSLLNFININTPIEKTDTLSVIFDEILEANEKSLREKNIKVVKRCEKDLPETYIHNEQIRFILHSVLQYVIFSTSTNETIHFVMKPFDFQDGLNVNKALTESRGGYVEVGIGFNENKKLHNPLENMKGIPENQEEEAIGLILRLVKEVLHKNRGVMLMKTNGKRPNTIVTLRFPVERRKVVYYAPITL